MIKKLKNIVTLENLICLFICICPVLDIVSFLYRNSFNTTLSPSTILRPIIPCIVFGILFFKEKNKMKKLGIAGIYAIYSIIHLVLFQKLHNGSSYGNIKNEIQYIVNYSLMIINLYNFHIVIKNKAKIKKAVLISLSIYVISLFISIITNTSSSTYLEGIGYKGYFESGNSLCTVLLLGLCIIMSDFDLKNLKNKKIMFYEIVKLTIILLIGIYLTLFVGMRTGLFGFCLIIGAYIIGKILVGIRDKVKISKIHILIITIGIVLLTIAIFVIGSKTLERRKMLKQNELNNIDEETGELRYVTGDILNIYKQIQKGILPEDYMSEAEKQAIIRLCEYAEKVKISNVNLREQQFIYNIFLVLEQKDISLILFGNGYKNQTGELVMEREIPALLCNFGIIGFTLYIGPFIIIVLKGILYAYKNRKELELDYIMYLIGLILAISLSTLSGYVFFSFSSMSMVIILGNSLCVERKLR